jgi:PAS domain S-box-containing protein
MSNLPGMAYRCRNDPNWTMVFVSEGSRTLLGCKPEDLIHNQRLAYADLILPEDRSDVEKGVAEGLGSTGSFELFYRIRRLDGQVRHVWEKGRLADRNPPSGHLEGFIMDISRLKAAEEGLRRSEQRYRTLTEMSQDQIFIVNREGFVLFVNGTASNAIQRDPADLPNRHLSEIFPPQTQQRMMAGILECLETRKPINRIARIEYPGEPLWLDTNLVPMFDDQGRAFAAMGVSRNVTEAREAEERVRAFATELQRSNAELERFAFVASHDLQEPLRSVAGFSRLLLKRFGADLDDEGRQYIELALAGAQRMEAMIQDLLAYARLGNARPERQSTDLNVALQEVLQNLQAAREEKAATITIPTLPVVQGDPGQLRQLFQNLLGNALKFTAQRPPRISVTARDIPEGWEFAVEDNGIGIDPADLGRAFEVFARLHPRDAYPGSGLGLPVCRKIVEGHGGRIWLESRLGDGTTVFFTLPRSPREVT